MISEERITTSGAGLQTVLVVDDDQVFRTQLVRAMTRRGFKVFGAASCAAARSFLASNHCDLAVLDLKLENESGLDLLEEIRHSNPQIKALILTGYGTIGTAVKALKMGAVNYVTKPTDTDAILAAFNLNSSPSSSSVPTPSLEQVEWDHMQKVLSEHEGNVTKAAQALGLHRRSLQRKLAKQPSKMK